MKTVNAIALALGILSGASGAFAQQATAQNFVVGASSGSSAQMKADWADYFSSTPVGNSRSWAGGTLVKTGPESAIFYTNGTSTNYGAFNLDPRTDLNWLAQQSPVLAAEWKANYGFVATPTAADRQMANIALQRETQSQVQRGAMGLQSGASSSTMAAKAMCSGDTVFKDSSGKYYTANGQRVNIVNAPGSSAPMTMGLAPAQPAPAFVTGAVSVSNNVATPSLEFILRQRRAETMANGGYDPRYLRLTPEQKDLYINTGTLPAWLTDGLPYYLVDAKYNVVTASEAAKNRESEAAKFGGDPSFDASFGGLRR